jgi:hypothetical protein
VVLSNLGTIRENVAGFLGNILADATGGLGRLMSGAANFLEQAPIGELLASLFNGLTTALAGLDMSGLGSQVGRILAALINQIGRFLEKVDLGALLVAVGRMAMVILSGIGAALSNLDWKAVLLIGLAIFTAWASTVLVGALISALTMAFAGLISAVLGALIGLPLLVILAVAAGIAALAFLIAKNWDTVSATAIEWFQKIRDGLANGLMGVITQVENFLVNAHTTVTDAISKLFTAIKNRILGMIPGMGGDAQPATSTVGSTASNLPGAEAFASISRAGGQLPVAFGGLLGAIGQEQASAPPGAKPVIANSSEFILRPDQARVFAAGAAMGGGGQANYNFSPTINLGAGTAESQAMEVLRYFEIWLSEHQQASLA